MTVILPPDHAAQSASSAEPKAVVPGEPARRISREEYVNLLAELLKPRFLQSFADEGEDVLDPEVAETAHAAATQSAESILRCVNEGHIDFSPLPDWMLEAAACMPRWAFDLLETYSGGIVNLSFPWRVRDCKAWDPSLLADHLKHSAMLAYLSLPAPRGENGVAEIDLRGLRQGGRLAIHIERDAASSLTVRLDDRAGIPSVKVIGERPESKDPEADPLLPGTSRFVWADEHGRESKRMKMPLADHVAYHHTVSVSADAAHDAWRQRRDKLTSLNGKARFDAGKWVTGREIWCRDITIWMLKQWRKQDLARESGEQSVARPPEHPSLEGMHSVAGLTATIPFEIGEEAGDWIAKRGGDVCETTAAGAPMADRMRGDTPGGTRYFTCTFPGLPGDAPHILPIRVRAKEKDGATVYAVRVLDPNRGGTWGRVVCRSLDELAHLSLDRFISSRTLAGYVRPEAPLCLIKEWPVPHGVGDHVPERLRGTPEHLWLACRASSAQLESALASLLNAEEAPSPGQLNPVAAGGTILKTLFRRHDKEQLAAFGRSIANASRRSAEEKASLAMHFIREAFAHDSDCEDSLALLAPLIPCVGVADFIRELSSSPLLPVLAKDWAFHALFKRCDEPTRAAVRSGLAAAFPHDDHMREIWERRFHVDDKSRTEASDAALALLPPVPAAFVARPDVPEPKPAILDRW